MRMALMPAQLHVALGNSRMLAEGHGGVLLCAGDFYMSQTLNKTRCHNV